MKKKFLTKPQFEAIAKEVLKYIPSDDKPMRCQEWAYLVDSYQKSREISEWQANNWTTPNWVAGGYQ
jgi:hypothetical protein